jgi:glutamate dehydrogenase
VRLIETFEAGGTLDRKVEGLGGQRPAAASRAGRQGADPAGAGGVALHREADASGCDRAGRAGEGCQHGRRPPRRLPAADAKPAGGRHRASSAARRNHRHKLANRIINRLGLVHPFELAEEEGCALADMAGAFVVADRLFGVGALWDEVDATDMPETGRLTLLHLIAEAMRQHMASILREFPAGFAPGDAVERLRGEGRAPE